MAEKLPRYRPLGVGIPSVPTVDYASAGAAAARGWQSMSAALDKMSGFAVQEAGRQRKLEWEEAGLKAPESVLEQLAGKKYSEMSAGERAGLETASAVYASDIEIMARKQMGQISLDAEKDGLTTEELNERLGNAVVGFSAAVERLSPKQAAIVQDNLKKIQNTAFLRSSEREMRKQEAERRAIGLEGVTLVSRDIIDRARVGATDFDQYLDESLLNMQSYMEHHGYTPEEIARERISVSKRAHIARVQSMFDRLEKLPEKKKFIEAFVNDIEKGGQMSRGLDDDVASNLAKTFKAEINADVSALKPKHEALKDRLRLDVTSVIQNGSMPNENTMTTLRKEFKELGQNGIDVRDQINALDNAEGDRAFFMGIKRANPLQLNGLRDELISATERGATGLQARRLKQVEDRIKEVESLRKSDPTLLAKQQGFVPEVNIVSMMARGDETGRQAVQDRIAGSVTFAAHHGVMPVFLTKAESERLSTALSTATPKEQMAFLTGISRDYGVHSRSVLSQIAKKSDVFAHVGGLLAMGGDAASARDALVGFKSFNDPNFKARGLLAAFERQAQTKLGNMVSLPTARGGITRTALMIYIGRNGTLDPKDIDEKIMESAFQDAAGRVMVGNEYYGGIDEFNGVRVIIPNTIKQGTFEDIVEDAPVDSFVDSMGNKPYAVTGENEQVLDVQRMINDDRLVFIPKENGVYSLQFKNQGSFIPVQNKNGGEFRLNIQTLIEGISKPRKSPKAGTTTLGISPDVGGTGVFQTRGYKIDTASVAELQKMYAETKDSDIRAKVESRLKELNQPLR